MELFVRSIVVLLVQYQDVPNCTDFSAHFFRGKYIPSNNIF